MPGLLKVILQGMFLKLMREKIRRGSLHAVRFYIGVVQQARLVSMAAVGVTTMAALVLVGFSFVAASLIWLLPVSREVIPYIFMGFGFILVIGGAVSLRTFFKEEHWMEMSAAYTLLDKVMTPDEAGAADAPRAEMRPETLFAHFAKQSAEKMREKAMSKPFPPQRPQPHTRMEPQEA